MSKDIQALEYNLPQNAYANFDAISLRDFMIEQLSENSEFTDQIYAGSNLNAIIEILAYYNHTLLFYLNQTATEGLFSQASLYENMNNIVKLIDYKPTGKQTSIIPLEATAKSDLATGSYKLRKYSYFLIDDIQYTILDDVSFEKTVSTDEYIQTIADNTIAHQGKIGEYPLYTAEGETFEKVTVAVDNLVDKEDKRFISHGSISVYVKEVETGNWIEYNEVDSLYLAPIKGRSYESRLNENGHYVIKFGNGNFGRRLQAGDEVAIYYILSDNKRGIITKNVLNGKKLFQYNTSRFVEIYDDINIDTSVAIDNDSSKLLIFNNPSNSTVPSDEEGVDDIRTNSSLFLSNQLRLVTSEDYEAFYKKTLPSVLNDVKVVDNQVFQSSYVKYFYDICVDPNKVNRVLLNQVNYADSCDFNNVNVFCVPPFTVSVDGQYPEFMSNNFKAVIKSSAVDKKVLSHEIVPRDPVYIAFDVGFSTTSTDSEIRENTVIRVTRERNNKVSKENLKRSVYEIITDFFSATNNGLGETIQLTDMVSSILSLQGVNKIVTVNKEDNTIFEGVSFITWNPLFEGSDNTLVNQSTTLEFFKFPYLYAPNALINKIEIVDE